MDPIGLLIGLLVLLVVIIVVKYVIAELPLPEPARHVALLIVGIVGLIVLLQYVGVFRVRF